MLDWRILGRSITRNSKLASDFLVELLAWYGMEGDGCSSYKFYLEVLGVLLEGRHALRDGAGDAGRPHHLGGA